MSKGIKKIAIHVLKVSVTAGILFLIFRKFQIGWDDITRAVSESNPWWFLASFGTQLGAITFSILRWNVLLRAQSLNIPPAHLVGTYLVGRLLGTFTPTGVGLEAYKAYDVARYTGRVTESVAVIFIEKTVCTFLALGFLALTSIWFIALKGAFFAAFIPFFGVLFILALIMLFKPSIIERVLDLNIPMKGKIEGRLREAVKAFTIYSRHKGSLLAGILLGFMIYIFLFLTVYTNARALHAGLGLFDVMIIGPLTQIASMIPLSIAGIGLREGAFVGLLKARDVAFEPAAATLAAMMWIFISYAVNIVGAILFLTRRTDYSASFDKDRMDALMKEGK